MTTIIDLRLQAAVVISEIVLQLTLYLHLPSDHMHTDAVLLDLACALRFELSIVQTQANSGLAISVS